MCFEGPEKTLEIEFDNVQPDARGARDIPRDSWDAILKDAGASILDHYSNTHFDSYILSESSLFVFNDKVVMKTCGTTTLLAALPKLTEASEKLNLAIGFTSFARKDLQFPDDQKAPHRNFNEEVKYFSKYVDACSAQILGPMTEDHWYLCTSPHPHDESRDSQCTLNIMMFDLDPTATAKFIKSPLLVDGATMTIQSGIQALLPQSHIHSWAFDPCGYSMNALQGPNYATVHVTPEPSCSYASFETTLPSDMELVRQVLDVFIPGRFTITLTTTGKANGFDFESSVVTGSGQSFGRRSAHHTAMQGRTFTMANYRVEAPVMLPH
jgi:S-adenosylmethionine decarboxylase